MAPPPPDAATRLARLARALPARVAVLEDTFTRIARSRMAGMPVMHPRLRVQAVGFHAGGPDTFIAWGVLVTPWFMNLIRLPLCPPNVAWPRADGTPGPAHQLADWPIAPGLKTERPFGTATIEVIGGEEDTLGPYEMSSLFSPMTVFADHDAAGSTAREVVRQLRGQP